MIIVLQSLGAQVQFDSEKNILEVDTTNFQNNPLVAGLSIKKFRASLLVLVHFWRALKM